MRFFEAAANWADRQGVDVRFQRDEFDGWFASLHFSDARGLFSTTVNAIAPRGKRAARKAKNGDILSEAVPAESFDDFSERVERLLVKAVVAARKARIRSNNKLEAVSERDRLRRKDVSQIYA